MEFALLIDLCTSSQTELFFQLIDSGNSREKVNLASSDLVELTGTFVPLTLRRLGFLEVDKDWKTFAGEEIPIFEGGVRPSVGPTDDYIFSGVCEFSAKTRLELKAGVIKNEAKSVRLDNKKRREQQRKTAQHDTQQRCLEDGNEEHPVGGKADGNVVVGIHHNIGDLGLGDSLFRFSATAEHAVEQVHGRQLSTPVIIAAVQDHAALAALPPRAAQRRGGALDARPAAAATGALHGRHNLAMIKTGAVASTKMATGTYFVNTGTT